MTLDAKQAGERSGANPHDLAEIKRGEIAKGADPVKAKREQKAAQEAAAARSTFREAADDYLAERFPKEKNRRKLQVMFKAELLPALGNMPLEEITRDHVPPICRRIDKRDAPHQARDVFSYARVVLNFAVEKGLLASSPLLGVRYGKPGKPRTRHFSVEEVGTFWTKLDTAPLQNDFKTIVRLQLLLGRRVSEVAGIERREINMDARLWTLPAERCKNGRELKVPITKMARAIIGELLSRGKGQLLIPNALGNPHDAKHSAKALAAAQDHFAFKTSFTTHDLRGSCGTFLRLLGVPEDVRAAVLGHTFKETVTDRHYNRADVTTDARGAGDLAGHPAVHPARGRPISVGTGC